jgi:hypothetical protein
MSARTTAKSTAAAAAAIAAEVPETQPLTAVAIVAYIQNGDMLGFQTEFTKASPEIQAEIGMILKAAQEAANAPAKGSTLEAEVIRVAKLAGVENHRCLGLVRSISIMEKSSSKILAINCDRYEGSKSTRNDRHPFPFTPANVAKNVKGNEADVMDQIEKFKPMALKAALAGLEILNPVAEASAEA